MKRTDAEIGKLIEQHGDMLGLLREAHEALMDFDSFASSDRWALSDSSREMTDRLGGYLAKLESDRAAS